MPDTSPQPQEPLNTAPPKGRAAAMPFIMVAVLIDMISIGLIIPVLAPLIGTFTSNQSEQTFWYGVVTFSFGIANFFGSPILGALSDAWGRRKVLLLGFAGLGLSFFVTAFASALWMLIAVRLVSGAMQANAAVANAYVADISSPEERAKRFGMLGAMFGVGFILGPVLGGLLGARDLHLPFIVAGCLAMVNLVYGLVALPESLPPERRRPFEWRRANPLTSLRDLTALRGVGLLVLVMACSGLAQLILHSSWVLYTTFKFGWGPLENGWSLFAVGLMMAIVQGGLIRVALKYFNAERIAVAALISSAVTFVLWGAATEGWMMFAIIGLNLVGAMGPAVLQTLVSNAADAKSQGRTMGAVAGLNGALSAVAPVLAASLLGFVSHLPRGDWRIGTPFFVCAALQFMATLLALLHFKRQPQPLALVNADAGP